MRADKGRGGLKRPPNGPSPPPQGCGLYPAPRRNVNLSVAPPRHLSILGLASGSDDGAGGSNWGGTGAPARLSSGPADTGEGARASFPVNRDLQMLTCTPTGPSDLSELR
jgi:hypothetical protein